MEGLHYTDFDLRIERTEAGYIAHARSPLGEGRSTFVLPFTDDRFELLILKLGHTRGRTRRVHSPELRLARELGGALFDAVFTGEVRDCYRTSLHDAMRQHGAGLRIRLRLQDVPRLGDLPWELLYDSSGDFFLAQSNQTPVVRYLELPQPVRPLRTPWPLRVLVMVSSPVDHLQLDVEHEQTLLRTALAPLVSQGRVEIEWMHDATMTELQRALRRGPYHIFHFVGHGGFDTATQEGLLVLEDEREYGANVAAHRLATLLRDHRSLRLAVLNSCEGARNSREDAFAGVATTLVRQGIPAVIAMQFEITDGAAIAFAGEFYAAIADGLPVDAALAEARKAIFAEPNDTEWATPVLYMRTPDGVIFQLEERAAPPVTAAPAAEPPPVAPALHIIDIPDVSGPPAEPASSLPETAAPEPAAEHQVILNQPVAHASAPAAAQESKASERAEEPVVVARDENAAAPLTSAPPPAARPTVSWVRAHRPHLAVAAGVVLITVVAALANPSGSIVLEDREGADPALVEQQNTPVQQSPVQQSPVQQSGVRAVTLAAPPFPTGRATPVGGAQLSFGLRLVSERANAITDEDVWFKVNGFAPPNAVMFPASAPLDYDGGRERQRVIGQTDRTFIVYGRAGLGDVLVAYDAKGQPEWALDFSAYANPPVKASPPDAIGQSIIWAEQIGHELYVSHGHNGYAATSNGMNAYVTALDVSMAPPRLLWRSPPLVSNARNWAVIGDFIVTGYGFTSEPDYLAILSRRTGEVVELVPLGAAPEYIFRRDDRLYVRTYNRDYVFAIDMRGAKS